MHAFIRKTDILGRQTDFCYLVWCNPEYIATFSSFTAWPPSDLKIWSPKVILRQAGTWDPWLQCLHLDIPLLELQNTKLWGLKITTCVQLVQILDQKIQTKNPIATSEEPKQANKQTKNGIRSKIRVLHMPPAHTTTKRWANHLSHPSSPTPGPAPTLTPFKDQAHPLRSKQGNLTLSFAPSCCISAPCKALPEFLVRPPISFYWLGKLENLHQYLYFVDLYIIIVVQLALWDHHHTK